jgi:hypothetical protein
LKIVKLLPTFTGNKEAAGAFALALFEAAVVLCRCVKFKVLIV